MPNRVTYCHRTALRYAEKRKTVDASSIDHCLKVTHEIFKTNIGHLAIGQSVSAGVVSEEHVVP